MLFTFRLLGRMHDNYPGFSQSHRRDSPGLRERYLGEVKRGKVCWGWNQGSPPEGMIFWWVRILILQRLYLSKWCFPPSDHNPSTVWVIIQSPCQWPWCLTYAQGLCSISFSSRENSSLPVISTWSTDHPARRCFLYLETALSLFNLSYVNNLSPCSIL